MSRRRPHQEWNQWPWALGKQTRDPRDIEGWKWLALALFVAVEHTARLLIGRPATKATSGRTSDRRAK